MRGAGTKGPREQGAREGCGWAGSLCGSIFRPLKRASRRESGLVPRLAPGATLFAPAKAGLSAILRPAGGGRSVAVGYIGA